MARMHTLARRGVGTSAQARTQTTFPPSYLSTASGHAFVRCISLINFHTRPALGAFDANARLRRFLALGILSVSLGCEALLQCLLRPLRPIAPAPRLTAAPRPEIVATG
eukprot:357146-Chlamydomonas_euryale.AAC.2